LKSVSAILINALATANTRGLEQKASPRNCRDTAMTTEIIHLTALIHDWLNLQVARHLAAQAAKLVR
jgi:geranylgeranyl pyrophosphate synthase